ncbi:phosphoribosylformylglycinamidine cyclo-ligase [Desulfuromusa kysingii]|uniref:Phosphoribosylformylglycinamidine cyclo-ligase n=1 Tax=Desulfuromusa kysingii TaxID=37625 RepID=A0A1H4CZV2_9BACT|nr:phosphoribosylformylglycinamidine cyclo-ligase [Desulfuromusa kysingii]SEA65592.1 phosphoribosylformylglycinamidine cyclo-ligase [Desulfuromusa kysingii]
MDENKPITYKEAGVDIDAGNHFVNLIKPLVKQTSRPEVLADIGGFGGLFSLNSNKYKRPTLVAATDGVGTKLKLAFMLDQHDSIGIDLVAMCVNDIIVQGAEPLFFLDYLATAKLSPEKAVEVVKGIVEGCKQANCALLGGETAEMPGMYSGGEYDLAGFSVGIVDNDKIIDGSSITKGDLIIGISSSGLHSNGFSLARRILIEKMQLDMASQPDGLDQTLGQALLTPTKIYVKSILNLIRDFNIKGIAHITGGGLLENIPRVLPQQCKAIIKRDSWEKPAVFELIREGGHIPEEEMYRTFNYGIGMALIVSPAEADDVIGRLAGLGEEACLIGEIAPADAPVVELV